MLPNVYASSSVLTVVVLVVLGSLLAQEALLDRGAEGGAGEKCIIDSCEPGGGTGKPDGTSEEAIER